MNREALKLMDDHHLVSVLHAEQSALTSTDAEMELLERFEKALDVLPEQQRMGCLLELADNYDLDCAERVDEVERIFEAHPGTPSEKASLLEFLALEEVYTVEELKEIFERAEEIELV